MIDVENDPTFFDRYKKEYYFILENPDLEYFYDKRSYWKLEGGASGAMYKVGTKYTVCCPLKHFLWLCWKGGYVLSYLKNNQEEILKDFRV